MIVFISFCRNDYLEIHWEPGRALILLEIITNALGISKDSIDKYIPESMQNQFEYLSKRVPDAPPCTPQEIGMVITKR